MKRYLSALLVLASLMTSAVTMSAPAQAAKKAGPSYGSYSSYLFDMRARVAQPVKKQGRLYVQINRNGNQSGDRQVIFKRQIQGKSAQVSGIRDLAPNQTITFNSGVVPCGKSISATLSARGRADANSAWTEWKSISANFTRSC
ncbi:hypothetical protein [Nocardioides sp. R-C-SC26]|uniref:hypothetical protein n=1 Tax=Nocardioides sp. R-C-SC26 TaxID=2870414 RepID=UPI001E547267|nr:hypothetical protein [Nocardioides sp. R-C-SC26]